MERLEANIKGRVQGVGFRYFVQRVAGSLGVCGYVRNMSDGSVEVVAEGKKEKIDELVAALKRGPSFSSVSDVDANRKDIDKTKFSGFEIRF